MTGYKKNYIRGYEVNEVSPLPHYFEEIYGHSVGISKIGPRGDKNYFWYSKDGQGAAFYEAKEQELSAKSTYAYLSIKKNRDNYFRQIEKILADVRKWIAIIEKTNITDLELKKLFKYDESLWKLDVEIISLYLISQPYRLQNFENDVRNELKKRVAKSRIDLYLARLTASDHITANTEEELAWCRLLLSAKKQITDKVNVGSFKQKYPSTHKKVLSHYEKYKILGLGDGNWTFVPEKEVRRFVSDLNIKSSLIKERIDKIKMHSKQLVLDRDNLLAEFEFPKNIVDTIHFLAHMSHVRYRMRIEGFIPIIYTIINTTDEMSNRLDYKSENFFYYSFMTHHEWEQTHKALGPVVPLAELKKRLGKHREYMLRINEGKIEYIFGNAAGKLYKELAPSVNHKKMHELQGVSAEKGRIEGSVTVYKWGDDMDQTLKNIKKHPILVAGQTRPAMMPVIREAKGIITDEGGVTSHAAIVARELKIPAVINTEFATKVFKTGDKVVLDADNGVVSKVK